MRRECTKVIAISVETGERMECDSLYGMARRLGVSVPAVCQALDRGGRVKGWNIYYTPEKYREKIGDIEKLIKELES